MKRTIPFKFRLFLALLIPFFIHDGVYAQMSAPTFTFTKMCAEPPPYTFPYDPAESNFNEFTVNFSFAGPGTYVLEMSNKDGFFVSPMPTLTILASQTVTSPGYFTFRLPSDLKGSDKYKFRIKNTAPEPDVNGPATGAIPNPDPKLPGRTGISAYYQAFLEDFTLNNNATDVRICSGGSATLSVDPSTPGNLSPLGIPNITYRWFKNGNPIVGETGSSLVVNSTGVYQAFIDYGPCSTFLDDQIEKSQKVNVIIASPSATFTLTSSIDPPNNICPSNPTTLSTSPGYVYKWFRNDVEIPNVTTNSYVTAITGNYKVQVDQGSCVPKVFTNTIQVNGFDFDVTFPALQSPSINKIPEGGTFSVTVTTTAANATYEWYNPGSSSPINTTDTFSTSTPIDGDYRLVVTQTTGCIFSKEILFRVKFGINPTQIPNTISPNGDSINDLWEIPQDYQTAEHEIFIVDAFGKEILKTTNYQNDWPQNSIEFKSVNPIFYYVISKGGSPVKKGSITVIK
ncbi:gliding motility-associated C-terminal domain-containing protein [Flavobacterium sp. GCM10027622]|uniref:T9SS type B sorting domain-containing protein n=1 Tax=unclassified Flavobacterium TaxID=196869 RepID=UPI0036069B86